MSDTHHGRPSSGPCDPQDFSLRRPRNRPALDALAYRIGQQPDFLARMLHLLPHTQLADQSRPLKSLTTRAADDPTVALIDAWACALDVLTFYQERIANEGYLRTAVERESVLELARMIGHELDPGVAASAALAFTVEDADDPFRVVDVPTGTQVMSIPKKSGELPQIFETTETIAARAEWNAIPARTERAQNLAIFWNGDPAHLQAGKLYLVDVDRSFDLPDPNAYVRIEPPTVASYLPVTPGLDLVQAIARLQEEAALNPQVEVMIRAVPTDHLHVRGIGLGIKPNDRVLAVGVRRGADGKPIVRALPFRVEAIEEEAAYRLSRLTLASIEAVSAPAPRFGLRFAPVSYRAGGVTAQPVSFNTANARTLIQGSTWGHAELSAFMRMQAWPREQLMRVMQQSPAVSAPAVGDANPGLYVFRQSAAFFGSGAPRWETVAKPDPAHTHGADPYASPWEGTAGPRTVWTDSQGNALTGFHAFLEREVGEIVPDSWTLFETSSGKTHAFRVVRTGTESRVDYALSGKATGLVLREPDGASLVTPHTDAELMQFTFRTASARVASEALTLSGLPIVEPVGAAATEVVLGGLYLDLEPGRTVSVRGERSDAEGLEEAETCILTDVTHVGGYTHLLLKSGLEFSYTRPSVRVNANVAAATHGETIVEPLGSGDATQANQAFKLAKPPLTFVSAPTATGSATTLEVRVDDVLWREVPALYEARGRDEVYQTRIDDDGATRIVFGEGKHGTRLPSGSLNVRATYRSGMGAAGEVDEETLALLKTRPLGIRAVTNPSPARGAADAENRDEARTRAPQSVRTLGRIVSLTDYEDFARAFAGIGKAKAVTLRRGRQQLIQVTVAPAMEGVFAASDATLVNLATAMERLRDPAKPLIVSAHAPRYFQLAAKVFHDARHRPDSVEAAVRAALLAQFGYAARPLAEPVSAAAVIVAIQSVAGVDHVDLDVLAPFSDAATLASGALHPVLAAAAAHPEATGDPPEIRPAELLTLLEAGIKLTMVAADA